MDMVAVRGFAEYGGYLEMHPDEFQHLFNTILINVTAFFRDEAAWAFLRGTVIPQILETHRRGETIRVWSAGCASGEETYTIAMLLAEVLGPEPFLRRVKIYATVSTRRSTRRAARLTPLATSRRWGRRSG
jgi:two-component system CheB/CheR fusion protein